MFIKITQVRLARVLYVLSILLFPVMLVSCGKQKTDSSSSVAKVDACSLVTVAMAKDLSPNLGAGHESKVPHPAAVSECVWDDPATHMPVLMLTVSPAGKAASVKADLTNGMGNMGYAIVKVDGLGDEAYTAIQKADPAHGLKEGLAILEVRVGNHLLGFSPMKLPITGPGTPSFAKFKKLVTATIENLKAAKK